MSYLKEEEIRPTDLMVKQRIFCLVDAGRLLSKLNEFVHVNCPACNANEALFKFEKNGFSYVTCRSCETFYVNPRPTPAILEWFYRDSPNYHFWNNFIFPSSEDVRRKRIFIPRVDQLIKLCNKYEVNKNSLLEIGAGFGTFSVELKKRNIFSRIKVVEPTPEHAATCRERGLDVLEKPVEKIKLEAKDLFDVVASFEVIEHLFAPADFIESMKNLLHPGGLIILTCPNGKGFDIETLGSISNTVDHEHLNYFNIKSLSKLLTEGGFEVLESFTPGELDSDIVRQKTLNGEFDLNNQPFLKKILINDWENLGEAFQNFLINNNLSSSLWIVAKKLCIK